MARFFISYRRKDSQQIVGRIYEKLTTIFGEDAVFLDVDDIPAGTDFRAYIHQMIEGSDALLVLIGREWVSSFSDVAPGDDDYVLIELEAALEQGLPLIPVLIGGTRMVDNEELPASIAPLSFRNAFPLDLGNHFDRDMSRLVAHLDALRMAQGKGDRHYADYRLAHQTCVALLEVFQDAYPVDDHPFGANMRFQMYSTSEFELPMNTGISLFLHRVIQDSTSLVELHIILTAWGFTAPVQQLIIGWIVEYLKRHPVLPAETLRKSGLDAIPQDATLRVFPSTENPREIWRDIANGPYQISASYVMRVTK